MLLCLPLLLLASVYAANLTITPSQATLSNTIIDVGQYSVANATVSGGQGGPYSGEWNWVGPLNGRNQTMDYQIINTINGLGVQQNPLTISPLGNIAYTSNSGTQVNVINLATNSVINTIMGLPNVNNGWMFSPNGMLAYEVACSLYLGICYNHDQGNFVEVNVATNTVVNQIQGLNDVEWEQINPQGTIAYADVDGSPDVYVIDLNKFTVINTISTGNYGASYAAFTPQGNLAYVDSDSGNFIDVINVATNTVINTIVDPSSFVFAQIVMNPQGTLAYVPNEDSPGNVYVINIAQNTIVNTISTQAYPKQVTMNPSGTTLYVTDVTGLLGMSVIDTLANTMVYYTIYTSKNVYPVPNPQGTLLYATALGGGAQNVLGPLPQTALQELSTVQASNGLLQLTIDAVSKNTLTFNFNGVTYTENTGANTIYGPWSLYGFAQDNGISPSYYGSNAVYATGTLTIDPSLVSNSLTIASNAFPGPQYITAKVSGGAAPYTYNFLIYNSMGLVNSMQFVSSSTTNTYGMIQNASWGYGSMLTINIVVTDGATTPESITNSITYNQPVPPLQALPYPFSLSNTVIDVGQISIANSVISSGGGSPYSGQWTWTGPNNGINQTTDFHVVNSINSGLYPDSVAINPSGTIAYVTNKCGVTCSSDGTLNVINIATNSVISTITLGSTAQYVAFNPSGNIAYAISACGASISCLTYAGTANVVNVATNTIINTINLGSDPTAVMFNPAGTVAYVTDSCGNDLTCTTTFGGTVNVINVATNTVINTINVGSDPWGEAMSPSGNIAYVTNGCGSDIGCNTFSGTLSVLKLATNTVINTIAVGAAPWGVAINPAGNLAYVVNECGSNTTCSTYSGTVNVINIATNSVINTIRVGDGPIAVEFNPSGTLAFVTNKCGSDPSCLSFYGTVTVINVATNTVVNTIPVGSAATGVAFDPSIPLAYITNQFSGTIGVIGNLSQTGVQNLNTVQASNGLLQMTINAVSNDSIIFTFNGVSYSENTGIDNSFGKWTIYGFAQDNGLNTYYFGSNTLVSSRTLTINPGFVPALSASPSSTVSPGGTEQFSATVNGGTPPYTYNYIVVNSVTNAVIANALYTAVYAATNTFDWAVNSQCVGNTITANVFVTDSASTPVAKNSTHTGAVSVQVPPNTGGGGGSNKSKGNPVVIVPINTTNQTGYTIYNISQGGNEDINVNNTNVDIVLDTINATGVGLDLNGNYTTVEDKSTIQPSSIPSIYVTVLNITYSPPAEDADISVYQNIGNPYGSTGNHAANQTKNKTVSATNNSGTTGPANSTTGTAQNTTKSTAKQNQTIAHTNSTTQSKNVTTNTTAIQKPKSNFDEWLIWGIIIAIVLGLIYTYYHYLISGKRIKE